MPMRSGPRAFGNSWPAYAWDWADLLAQEEADEQQKQSDAQAQNRTRLLPSSVGIMRMETAMVWPARGLTLGRLGAGTDAAKAGRINFRSVLS